jgi:hypothetical protein
MLQRANCLDSYNTKDTSLLAQVLLNLEVRLQENLPSLNSILAKPRQELARSIAAYHTNPNEETISNEERKFIYDLIQNKTEYMDYLLGIQKQRNKEAPGLLRLLGEYNVSQKLEEISHI